MQWERMSGERLPDAERKRIQDGGKFSPPSEQTTDQHPNLVGSSAWVKRAREVAATDQYNIYGDYLSDALDEIARLQRILGDQPPRYDTTQPEEYCPVCQSVRMGHCSDPVHCGNVRPISDKTTDLCGCMRCVEARVAALPKDAPIESRMLGPAVPGWRYACEICGNKRCPHHTNHRFSCTGSNATGQAGL